MPKSIRSHPILIPDQFCLIWHRLALISIERNLSELINIGINARILFGIDRYWALSEGVLTVVWILT